MSSTGSQGSRALPRRSDRRRELDRLVVTTALGLTMVLGGCSAFSSSNSFSESSGSVSDSIGSFSDSSRSSGSSSGDDEQAYRRELRTYVAVAAARDLPPSTLRRGVSEIALGFGVSDWEAAPATRDAITAGLDAATPQTRDRYLAALALAPLATGASVRDARGATGSDARGVAPTR